MENTKEISGWTLYDDSSAGAPSGSGGESTRLNIIFTNYSDALVASLQQYKGGVDYVIRKVTYNVNYALQEALGGGKVIYTLPQVTVVEPDLKSFITITSIVEPQHLEEMLTVGSKIDKNIEIQIYENLAEYSADASKLISRGKVQEKITTLEQSKKSRGKRNPRNEKDEALLQKYKTALAHFDAGNVPGYNPSAT